MTVNKQFNTKFMVELAMMIAIIVVMSLTPLGYIKLPGLTITFLTVPVAVGAILLGPIGGIVCGATFGLTSLYQAIRPYILPEDFSTDFYRQVASLLFAQLEEGQVNPAKIIDCFTDAEEQRQAASLFNTQVPVQTEEEQKKAIRETVRKVMETALEQRSASLDPSDIASLQKVIEGKRKLQELDRLHISLE